MKKRLLSLALALVMALTLLPLGTMAAGDGTPHTHEVEGETVTFDHALTDGEGNALLVDGEKREPASDYAPIELPAGSYRVEEGITLGGGLGFADGAEAIALCLNGSSINMNNCFQVNANTKLTVSDCSEGGAMTNAGMVIDIRATSSGNGELVVEGGKITNTADYLGAIGSSGYVTLKGGELTGPCGVYLNHNSSYDKAMLTLVGTPTVSGSKADIYLVESEALVNTIPFLDATAYTGDALTIELEYIAAPIADKLGAPIVKLGDTPADKFSLTNSGYCLQEQTVDGARCLVLAQEPPHTHTVSVDCSTETGEQVTFTALASQNGALYIDGVTAEVSDGSYLLPGGDYYLAGDMALDKRLEMEKSSSGVALSHLCLNGHELAYTGTENVEVIGSDLPIYSIVICDCDPDGGPHTIQSPVTGEEVAIHGGLITGSKRHGVRCDAAGVNLYGGTIAGNGAGVAQGGGVKADGFTMYGGAIVHNKGSYGGGVYVGYMGLTMSGGEIRHNWAAGKGGGVDTSIRSTDLAPSVVRLSGSPVIKDNVAGESKTPSNLCLVSHCVAEVTASLGEAARIGLSAEDWSKVDTQGPQKAAQGYGSYTATADDYAKLSCDNGKYQLTLDDGMVYFEPAPRFSVRYENGNAIVDAPTAGSYTVVFAAYDADHRLTDLAIENVSAQVGETPVTPKNFTPAATVKVMLLDSLTTLHPLCPAATWEKQ